MTNHYPVLTQQELEDLQRLLPVSATRLLLQSFLEGEAKYDVPKLGRRPVTPAECTYQDMSIGVNIAHLLDHLDESLSIISQLAQAMNNGDTEPTLVVQDETQPFVDLIHLAARILILIEHLIVASHNTTDEGADINAYPI